MKRNIIAMLIGFTVFSACQEEDFTPVDQLSNFIDALPQEVIHPIDNPYSPAKAELGRLLFWDPVLSGTKDVACATCHHPDFAYADGLAFSRGVEATGLGPDRKNGLITKRNASTVLNTAFNGINQDGFYEPTTAPMFWDNRAAGLEAQALLPLLSKEEMRGAQITETAIIDTIVQRLNAIPEYEILFAEAFGSEVITIEKVLQAIATFERQLIAPNSRFDQYIRGNTSALSSSEIDGMHAFINVGCANCHSGPMFSDFQLHTIGVRDNLIFVDEGATEKFDFRTPSLRNLAMTAPYMHNGRLKSLKQVLDFYEDASEGEAGEIHPNVSPDQLDPEIKALDLQEDEKEAIIDFLNSLNDHRFDRTIPTSVPSNLQVGGDID